MRKLLFIPILIASCFAWAGEVQNSSYAISGGDFAGFPKEAALTVTQNQGGGNNYWCSSQTGGSIAGNAWWGQQFPTAQDVTGFSFQTTASQANNNIGSVLIQYDNGSAWVTAHTWSPSTAALTNVSVTFPSVGAYTRWRLLANANAPSAWCFNSVKITTGDAPPPPPPPPPPSAGLPVIVVAGQSLCANFNGTSPYTVRHVTNLKTINFNTGAISQAADPLPGADGPAGSFIPELGDLLLDRYPAKFPNGLVVVSLCAGGSTAAQWGTGGAYHSRIATIKSQIAALGHTPFMLLWVHGHTDAYLRTSATSYRANLVQVISSWQSGGNAAPVMIAPDLWQNGLLAGYREILAALLSTVDGSTVIAGPNMYQFGNEYRIDGSTAHMTNVGKSAQALSFLPIFDLYFSIN